MEQFEKMGTNTINIYDYSWGSTDISQDLYEYCLTLDPELMVGFTLTTTLGHSCATRKNLRHKRIYGV